MSAQPQVLTVAVKPVLITPEMERVQLLEARINRAMFKGILNPSEIRRAYEALLKTVEQSGNESGAQIFSLFPSVAVASQKFSITSREADILGLLTEGMSNLEIAARLFVAEQTVKFHLTNIYRKLHVNNRTKAVAVWRQATS